jgi:hypothetical protein
LPLAVFVTSSVFKAGYPLALNRITLTPVAGQISGHCLGKPESNLFAGDARSYRRLTV